MVRVRSNILFKDYVNYVFMALKKKKIILVAMIVCAAAIVFLAINLIINATKGNLQFINYLPLFVIVALLIFYFGLFYGMTSKQYRRGKLSFQEESDYIFLNNKFVIARAGTDSGYDIFYNSIVEIIETKKRLYFFVADNKSFMIKKENFISGDIVKLRSLLTEQCKTAKKRLKK